MMLVDDVIITMKAGRGGRGARTFLHLPNSFKTPADGGNGGRGGDIFVQGSNNVSDLSEFRFKKTIEADDGESGGVNNMYGKAGSDTTILLPLGTHVTNTATEDSFEVVDTEPILIAQGGSGGLGNKSLLAKPLKIQHKYSREGEEGEEKNLHLELKFIADIGLVGLPNAGKSSLLASLTNAEPKIGDYAFTTLEPQLGVLPVSNKQIIIADIPGLIEGAHQGIGLGIAFLKHIEKTKILLHLIDVSASNPIESYKTIQDEFKGYKEGVLLDKKEIIVLTKTDLVDTKTVENAKKSLKKLKKPIVSSSIYNEQELTDLSAEIVKALK